MGLDFRFHGWFRWSPRDAWTKAVSANDHQQCWELLVKTTLCKHGLYSLVVLPSNEAPFTLKRGNKR